MHELNETGLILTSAQKNYLGISIVNDLLGIVPDYFEGKATQLAYDFQAWQENQNAELLRARLQDIMEESQRVQDREEEQALRKRGEQIVAMGASGFEVDSKSYQDLIKETDRNTAMNIAAIQRQYANAYANQMLEADLRDIQASYYRRAGSVARKQSFSKSIISGATGALRLAGLLHYG